MRTRILAVPAAALAAVVLSTGVASASVTINPDGTGFIGKGNVQTALGMNNAALQKAVDAKSLVFTGSQSTSQTLDQTATQSGSQAGVQTVSQDLTCTFTNGSGTKTFHRDGTREASRDAARDASREGTRTGTRTGSLNYALDVDARKANQYTGFILKGFTQTSTSVTGESFGDWSFGDWSFGAWSSDATATEWGDWDAAPGENPDDCLRSENADKITQISNVITPGDTEPVGDVVPGDVHEGGITEGPVTYGPLALFVNGKAL